MQFLKDYIGQKDFVRMAENLANAVLTEANVPFPVICCTGLAGSGKTKAVSALVKAMMKAAEGQKNHLGEDDKFVYVELNSAISLPDLVGRLAEVGNHRRAIFFIDEAAAINKKVLNYLKSVLETDNKVKEVRYQDFIWEANPFRHLWVFASNENLKDSAIFGPSGRAMSIQFQPYSKLEVVALMKYRADRYKKQFQLTDEAIEYFVERVLPNGRAIKNLIDVECLYTGGKITIDKAKKICKDYYRFPMGLGLNDVRTLKFLNTDLQGKQVNEIASNCGGEPNHETSYRLTWLAGFGLTDTKAGKKRITTKGIEYLSKLADSQKKTAATKKD